MSEESAIYDKHPIDVAEDHICFGREGWTHLHGKEGYSESIESRFVTIDGRSASVIYDYRAKNYNILVTGPSLLTPPRGKMLIQRLEKEEAVAVLPVIERWLAKSSGRESDFRQFAYDYASMPEHQTKDLP
jgi:hypothetical protein